MPQNKILDDAEFSDLPLFDVFAREAKGGGWTRVGMQRAEDASSAALAFQQRVHRLSYLDVCAQLATARLARQAARIESSDEERA